RGALVGIMQHRGIEAGEEQMIAAEARLAPEDLRKATQECARGPQEHESEGHLRHHQALAAPEPTLGSTGRIAGLEGRDEVGACRLERGCQTEDDDAQPRGEKAEEEDAAVELDAQRDELVRHGDAAEELDAAPGQDEAQGPTEEGENEALRQELPN